MSGKEKADPDFTAEPSWELRHNNSDDVNHGYFFDSHDYRESTILSEFGWNIPAESSGVCGCDGGFVDFDPIEPDFEASRADNCVSAASSAPPSEDISRSSIERMVMAEKVSASASPSNPSISSSSSEDQAEKSTASGVSSSAAAAAIPPSETASKVKKKGLTRIRQPRFAFVTKSEVDHLEDGYRWRKYGQKAVKNSPFPRSYYRCTNSKCMVKKRIERSNEDPSVVITTYEGQHCHHSVGYPRGGGGLMTQETVFPRYLNPSTPQLYHPRFPHLSQEISPRVTPLSLRVQAGRGGESHTAVEEARSQNLVVGEGLLGDIVPSRMRNE